ncbi:hypothetical protein AB2M62_05555 [Sphingomonas sp. MMS12-HWE2-04]|uniref:hypothetical protein n=1 Tax=Sphingomonas sp. MMS12-HWE2-04 TaxID=3234199 RepID=UPI00384FFF92
MRGRIDTGALPYGVGAIGLGLVTIHFHRFALQWQPVPASVPANFAWISGLVLLAGGIAALTRGAGAARLLLPAYYFLWVVALHAPAVARAPSVGSLLGLAEILALASGGTALVASGRGARGWLGPAARMAFGLSALVFGLSHFVYTDLTAAMVPGWIPHKLYWAYATGAAHAAAGLAILSGIAGRLAATLLAVMAGGFVVLLHIPRVAAAPSSQLEWTMLFIATSIAGAALLVRRWLR